MRFGGRAGGWGAGPVVLLGEVVQGDGVQGGSGDLLALVEDGGDCGAAQEAGEAADAPGGALVQVGGQPHEAAEAVALQVGGVLHRSDGLAERPGDHRAAAAGSRTAPVPSPSTALAAATSSRAAPAVSVPAAPRAVCTCGGGQGVAVDQTGTAGELRAGGAGEQGGGGDVDTRVHECRRDPLGEVFEEAGGFGAGARVEAVDLVDFTDRRSS